MSSMRVTFDTNTLADIVEPEAAQRRGGKADGSLVRAAIQSGRIDAVFCETAITLEGIKNADRSTVFGSTTIHTSSAYGTAPDGNGITYINMRAEQTARKALDARQANRFQTAFDLGLKLIGAPRVAMVRVDDPEGTRYLAAPEDMLARRIDRYHVVVEAIEARGLGCAQAMRLAGEIQGQIGGLNSFIFYLGHPRSAAEQKKINRAIAEWADGDSIAAHYGYGIDLFCSEDFGKSSGVASVLGAGNRAWLTSAFGIQFVTLGQLASLVAA